MSSSIMNPIPDVSNHFDLENPLDPKSLYTRYLHSISEYPHHVFRRLASHFVLRLLNHHKPVSPHSLYSRGLSHPLSHPRNSPLLT